MDESLGSIHLPFGGSHGECNEKGSLGFYDRMLVLQRWNPFNNPLLIKDGYKYVGSRSNSSNREIISHISRAMGNLMEDDYDVGAAARVPFLRVQINWDVQQPLRFQRNFQFQAGINTLLHFRYERLRGFCEVCGLMTHDSGACIIQNGGDAHFSDDDLPPAGHQNQGVIIREINELVEEMAAKGSLKRTLVSFEEGQGSGKAQKISKDGENHVAGVERPPMRNRP